MKTIRFISTVLLVALTGHPAISQAEDIDIYSGSASSGIPNVMIIMDNAANSDAQMAACYYLDGTQPTYSNTHDKAGDNYMCALDAIVSKMTTKSGSALVNLGITLQTGVYLTLTPVDDNVYAGTFAHSAGQTNRQVIIAAIRGITKFAGNATQGTSFQETWAYYTGGNGGTTNVGIKSGTVYTGTNATTGCQKNYAIFISGVTSSAHANTDSNELTALTAAVNNAVNAGNLTSAQRTTLLTQIASSTESPWAVEWARFMKTLDINTTAAGTGVQSIITYAVAAGSPVYPATMGSMENYIYSTAKYGGGKYFPATNYAAIYQNILKILNEVQAVNSVFSSSSLPVSVNAQGTYLNQIYMGMFRPDSNGNPRWMGNLKQYHFTATRDPVTHLISLSLGDSLDASAINPATGFISPNAVSYWTCGGNPSVRACSPVADPVGGFWINDSLKADSTGKAYDLPDGEWVDKGGAAQIARLANLTNNYTTAAGTATNPRKLYTCTGVCASGNALSGYLFANSNADLTAASFGIITPKAITSLTRSGNTATVTVAAHGVTDGQVVQVSGANESEYNGSFVMTYVDANTLRYTINVAPASPATGTIVANVPPAGVNIASLTRTGSTVTVSAPGNTLLSGDSANISGVTPADYNGTWAVNCGAIGTLCSAIPFTFTGPAEGPVTPSGGGTAAVSGKTTRNIELVTAAQGQTPTPGLVRVGTTVTVQTTANHGFATGDLATIAGAGDSGYNIASRAITVTGNRTFTYTLPATTPATPATVLGTVSKSSGSNMVINSLTRTLGAGAAATATATTAGNLTVAPFGLTVGNSYLISISGAGQSQYNGTFNATITSANTFTYSITTTPATAATGTMILGSSLATPDLINWVRGYDNAGDEFGPGGSVTIRPSLHGDVLHSRPVTVNYGGTTGVVVFYGGNDGVYRAINGNQTAAIGTVPAGGELWGFIPPEFFSKLKRLHDNSPILPSPIPGISPTPQKKDYFADGSTGIYQKFNADGTTNTAYLYVSMRRGGKFIYALDVTDPANPKYLWKITNTGNFTELGQTWSAPKVALIKGYNDGVGNAKPVLIFGAGYAATQDTEPPGADTMGRGIYIVDAVTGALVWRATYGAGSACSAVGVLPATCTVAGMNYSIPSDITLVDRDSDGYIDRLYAADVGGNVWRVDLQREGPTLHNTPDYWRVNKVASLGGGTGTTLHKFFYPLDVILTTNYDVLIAGAGDREHPLSATEQNRIYMLRDLTGNDGSSLATIVEGDLFNATSATYTAAAPGSGGTTPNKGYFINLLAGEKVVNAPLTVAGSTYVGTNQPTAANTCSANLGIARGYKLNPLTGAYNYTVFTGGGLPPSPVAGVVSVTVAGESAPVLVPFVIGGGSGGDDNCTGTDCGSALGGFKPVIKVPTSRKRTYWYQEMD